MCFFVLPYSKTMKSTTFKLIAFLLGALLLQACSSNPFRPSQGQYGIFQVEDGGESALVENGTIDGKSLKHFERMMEDHPEITRINVQEMPGSENDEVNVQLGRAVHALDMHVHILDNGMVASGGTDFFLAGTKRTVGSGVRIGVHSWSSGGQEATDCPEDSPEHDLFLDYYEAIGFSKDWSREFYFFTINAETAANIHWMTEAEIEQYGMLTN